MSHLVSPVRGCLNLDECERQVREAHDYLAASGIEALARAVSLREPTDWGGRLKRLRVMIGPDAPSLIGAKSEEPLAEVMNQCATMERLLDALAWAQSPASGLAKYSVELCHPTTSSDRSREFDNDLVLIGPNGRRARFEISDVASDKDGNGKEFKDLCSLGVLGPAKTLTASVAAGVDTWPDSRLFLVVAPEFARRLRKKNRTHLSGSHPHCHYVEVFEGTTVIFEVFRGATQ